MGHLIESTFVTLDGVIGSPEKWGGPYWDDEHNAYGQSLLDRADAVLLGRATYDIFAASWPSRGGDPFADRINALPKFVATRSPGTSTWNNTTFLEGDLAAAVKGIKDQFDGDILKFGTGEVDQELLAHSLIDEFHFWVLPVIAGGGARLLDHMVDLTHLEARGVVTFRSGIVVHVCAPRRTGGERHRSNRSAAPGPTLRRRRARQAHVDVGNELNLWWTSEPWSEGREGMGTTYLHAVASLDGYIADQHHPPRRLSSVSTSAHLHGESPPAAMTTRKEHTCEGS